MFQLCSRRRPMSSAVIRLYATGASLATDNKHIANRQKLYVTDKVTPGSTFFLPNGARIFNRLIEFMRVQQRLFGFQEVITPVIYKQELWKTSGHYQHYKEDMFEVSGFASERDHSHEHSHEHSHDPEQEKYGLKPMNCPGHCVMFSKHDKSFRELPVRYADFSPLHRNESSGALSGLTRVRKFHQDDGHIFCERGQIETEIGRALAMIETAYCVFGLGEYRLALSTRPEGFVGTLDVWEQAEEGLKKALERSGKEWHVNPGDGAFYGPKIDILVKDNNGKEHQTATIQLDFQLPEKFELEYVAPDGELKRPVMIHRAVFGSLERFMAILMDHYQGKWPFWVNPRQAVIIPVSDKHVSYASKIHSRLSGKFDFQPGPTSKSSDALDSKFKVEILPGKLSSRYFNVDLMAEDETVGLRTRRAIEDGYSYILMVGDREVENGTVSIRSRDNRKTKTVSIDEVAEMFSGLEDRYE